MSLFANPNPKSGSSGGINGSHIGDTPPSNKKLIWVDTSTGSIKYFDETTSTWRISQSAPSGDLDYTPLNRDGDTLIGDLIVAEGANIISENGVNFDNRPKVNGIGVMLQGEAPTEDIIASNILFESSGNIASDNVQDAINEMDDLINNHKNDESTHVTESDKNYWNAKSDFSGNYADLSGLPVIPTKTSQLTNDSGYITDVSNKADVNHTHNANDITNLITTIVNEINKLKGNENGLAELDANKLIPIANLPPDIKELRVVQTIEGRNSLENLFEGLSVFVIDANGDQSGGAFFIYDGANWQLVSNSSDLSAVLDWSLIQNKPTEFNPTEHTHSYNDLEDLPELYEPDNKNVLEKIDELDGVFSYNGNTIFDMIYPIGSIYMTTINVNPSTYFKGEWVEWGKGRVPVGVDPTDANFNTVEKMGGSASLQAHTHSIPSLTGTAASAGNHSHITYHRGYWGATGGSDRWNASRQTVQSDPVDESGWTNVAGAHTHLVTTNASVTGTAGTGDSGNLQPYITCYMWKRIG